MSEIDRPLPDFNKPWFRLTEQTANISRVETTIRGDLPEWVEGSLYRNGPGIFKIGKDRLRHLFDGFSVLHRYDIHSGKVFYTSRVLDSETWTKSVKADRLVTTQFGTYAFPDPCKRLFKRAMSYLKPYSEAVTDNTSVNIVPHGDQLFTLTETPRMLTVDPESLQKRHTLKLDQVIAVHMSTAHPHFDKEGNMYNLGTCLDRLNYSIIRIPPPDTESDDAVLSAAEQKASLESRWPGHISYNHSFGMSRDHYVILEQPITLSKFKFTTGNWRRLSALESFDKFPEDDTVFRVVRREDGQEVDIKYRAAPLFTFHFVNCFEVGEELVVDFVGYSDLGILDSLYVERLDNKAFVGEKPYFRRYVLPLKVDPEAEIGENLVKYPDTKATAVLQEKGTVLLAPDYITKERTLMELPRINYSLANGKKYRYVYGTSIFSEKPALKKLDIENKEEKTWSEEGYQPGEPVFVQRPGATDEDDGVILSPIVSMEESKPCFLLVLDARTFTEQARAVAPQGQNWPLTFHGSFLPKDK